MWKTLRLRSLAATAAVAALAAITGGLVADATAASPPSASGTRELVNAPAALLCGGEVGVKVTITGTAEVKGTATDVVFVVDLSGSMVGQKLTHAKTVANAIVAELDEGDGQDDGVLGLGNRVAIVTYKGTSATTVTFGADTFSTSESAVTTAIGALTAQSNAASPHAAGIAAANAIASTTKAIVVLTDAQGGTQPAVDSAGAAIPIGLGTATSTRTNLLKWVTNDSFFQWGPVPPSGQPAFSVDKAIADSGAAYAVDASFQLTETLGATFTASNVSGGTVSGDGKTVTASGSLGTGETATITYTATRNGSDLFSVTEEEVSSGTLAVTGGSATLTPDSLKLDVLPCDATLLAPPTECTGSACSAGGTQGGLQYSLNAGTPAAGTEIFVAGLSSTPPAGACPGFDANTNGVQFDIRPLTTAGTFEIRIPKAALGSKKWWQTDVCVGTNLRFITKVGSLANLRPGASNVDSRWWGLLPSIKRYTLVNGKLVAGPWITQRTVNSAGDAIIRFTMPYVGGSENVTTNGAAAYDPKVFGG